MFLNAMLTLGRDTARWLKIRITDEFDFCLKRFAFV